MTPFRNRRFHEPAQDTAAHDTLTGLSSHPVLRERLVQALARARRHRSDLAVLRLDLDGFTAINEESGRQAGDAILREVARRIRAVTRVEDTVARVGADEFAVLVEDVGSANALVMLSHRMIAAVRRPFDVADVPRVGVSIGIALSRRGTGDAEVLLGEADDAMRRARAGGGNRCEWAASSGQGR